MQDDYTDEELEIIRNSPLAKKFTHMVLDWLQEIESADNENQRVQNINHLKDQLNNIFDA